MKTIFYGLLYLSLLSAISPQIIIGGKFDPGFKWRSIKTKHFWIHFHQGLEKQAQTTARLAEKIHTKLAKKIRWEPSLRTDVVLVDSTDLANGLATPFPYNKTVLFPVRPNMDSTLENFDHWLDLLFTHEYTHILSLDMAYGPWKVMRYIFGRLLFITPLQPFWVLEGYAVHLESERGFGRNHTTYAEMIMRAEVMDDSFNSLHDVSHAYYRNWPPGGHYIYGGRFIHFLEDQYGANSFTNVYQTQAGNGWPWQASDNMQRVYGKDLDTLWHEWEHAEKKKQNEKILKIKEKPITSHRLLTQSGFNSGKGRFDPSGEFLYFIRDANDTETRLLRYRIPKNLNREWFAQSQNPDLEIMSDVNLVNALSVGPDGQIFISDMEIYRNFSRYQDVFLFSASGFDLKQLSNGLRAAYPDYNASQDKLVFVQNSRDRYSIVISGKDMSNPEKVIADSSIQLGFTRFSPDGKKLAFSFKDASSFSHIAILDLDTGAIFQITRGLSNHFQPSWHPAGDRILFSSDGSEGVYNLFEYNIPQKKISQLTNVIGGLFHPDVSPDGKWIAATSYNSQGFNQALLSYPSKKIGSQKAMKDQISIDFFHRDEYAKNTKKESLKESFSSERYKPWASIFPLYWVPQLAYSTTGRSNSYGFAIASSDALNLNSYFLSFTRFLNLRGFSLSGRYTYSGFWPDLSIFYTHTQTNLESRLDNQAIRVGISLPFTHFQKRHILRAAYALSRTKRAEDTHSDSDLALFNAFWMGRASLGYVFSNSDFYRKSIRPEDGRLISIDNIFFHDITAPGMDGVIINASMIRFFYAEYLPGFFRNHVFSPSLMAGGYFGDPGGFYSTVRSDTLGIWGYSDSTGYLYGANLRFTYSLPIWQPDVGFYKILPALVRNIWLDIYFNVGSVSDKWEVFSFYRTSVGAQLNYEFVFAYAVPFVAFIRYTYGLNKEGDHQINFGISSEILSIFFERKDEHFDFQNISRQISH